MVNEPTGIDNEHRYKIEPGKFQKFPSIERFSDVVYRADKDGVKSLTFLSKIKLHGTNGALHIMKDGTIKAQKRTSILKPTQDNAGFRAWAETLKVRPNLNQDLILFGEWAGPGIQRGDAVCQIPEKHFFIFMAVVDNEWIVSTQQLWDMMDYPIFEKESMSNIRVLPSFSLSKVDFSNDLKTQEIFDYHKEQVEQIGRVDPYIKSWFKIEAPGEGLVFYPVIVNEEDEVYQTLYPYWRDYTWKMKTEAHSEVKRTPKIRPEKPAGVDEFLNNFITETRMQKILDEQFEGRADRKDTGKFLKAVMSDVHKESKTEIELAEFTWGEAARYGPSMVKRFFFERTG